MNQKKSRRGTLAFNQVSLSEKNEPKQPYQPAFLPFIFSKANLIYLCTGITASIVYFIILRILYPVPSTVMDSFTYLAAAQDRHVVSFRPIGYSYIIRIFKIFSVSDVALLLGQYFSNVLANLLLFFTSVYLVSFRKLNKLLLFALLVFNPLYIMYSNYILTDAFFSAFTVLWFTTLIWMMYRPRWYHAALQLLLLVLLFMLRYNAFIFPAITIIALYLTKQKLLYKFINIGLSFLVIGALTIYTIHITKKVTGTATFSAFSGWQMANNAMHILPYQKPDTTFKDAEVKKLSLFLYTFYDTTSYKYDSVNAHAGYMWHPTSPLKLYMPVYAKNKGYNNSYFNTWTALGDVYAKFGKSLILKYPGSYFHHFVLPNTRAYFTAPLESYNNYFNNTDTIPLRMQQFYQYKSNKVGSQHKWIYDITFKPWPFLFPVLNILFLVSIAGYCITKRYTGEASIFNKWLICFVFLYVANFLFIVLLAPTVFRYHTFIVTLMFPPVIYLLQQLTRHKEASAVD